MDIRETLEAAYSDDTQVPESPTIASPAADVSADKPVDRPRDEVGRFAAKVEAPEPQVDAAVVEAPVRKPPSSWKPEAQTAWAKADKGEPLTAEEVRLLALEAERREGDFHKGVQEFKTHSERARAYDAVVTPYRDYLQTLGVDAPTAINALLNADKTLRTGNPQEKAAYFARLAQEYGIDIGQVQNPTPVDPQTQYLMQKLHNLEQQHKMWESDIQRQQREQAESEIRAFGEGKTHLDAVRGDMADLLSTGKAKTLNDAYDMAVWMRPDIRQTLIEQQRADAQRKAAEQAQAQRARTAAVSVKGSSPSSGGASAPSGSLRDQLAAAFAND